MFESLRETFFVSSYTGIFGAKISGTLNGRGCVPDVKNTQTRSPKPCYRDLMATTRWVMTHSNLTVRCRTKLTSR